MNNPVPRARGIRIDKYGIRTWTGTSQVRSYTVAGDTLTLETRPRTAGTDTRAPMA